MYSRHFLTILHLYTNISSPPTLHTQPYTDNLEQQASPCSLSLCEDGILFGSHTLNRLSKGLDRGKECKIIFGGRHHKGLEYFFR
jgi:hypothetical protein